MSDDEFRCICDLAVRFEPADPTPVAVEGCPAHPVRRAVQLWIRQNEPGPFGWRCVAHPDLDACDAATTCRMRLAEIDQPPRSAWTCGPDCPEEDA